MPRPAHHRRRQDTGGARGSRHLSTIRKARPSRPLPEPQQRPDRKRGVAMPAGAFTPAPPCDTSCPEPLSHSIPLQEPSCARSSNVFPPPPSPSTARSSARSGRGCWCWSAPCRATARSSRNGWRARSSTYASSRTRPAA